VVLPHPPAAEQAGLTAIAGLGIEFHGCKVSW